MKKIDRNSSVFDSDEYKKDRNQFYIIEQSLLSPEVLLYSDETKYLICRGQVGRPVWIWTVDGMSLNTMKEVAEIIAEHYLTEDTKCKLTAKREFYAFLKGMGFPYLDEDYFEMGSLECHQVKRPRKCDGYSKKAAIGDIEILAKYWYEDNREMNSLTSISRQQAEEEIKAMLETENLWVWRNASDKIVCMVHYRIAGSQVKLSHVYTPRAERCKGYATNLIYDVTKMLLEMNLEPLLYTDYHYIASNKAYKNAGYTECGVLINFSCSKRDSKISL